MNKPDLASVELQELKSYFNSITNYSYGGKEKSEEFCGFYLHGSNTPLSLEEHETPIRCFRHFSKYSYPLYLMYNEEQPGDIEEILKRYDNIIAMPIKPLESVIHYDLFVFRELFERIRHNNILTIQWDAWPINPGWESFVENNQLDYVGAVWQNMADGGVLLKNHEKYNIQFTSKIGNDAFSFRRRDLCLKVMDSVDGDDVNWRYNGFSLPEDVFFSYFGFGLEIFRPCSVELANQWALQPMASWDTYGFHKTQIHLKRKYQRLFEADVEVIKAPRGDANDHVHSS